MMKNKARWSTADRRVISVHKTYQELSYCIQNTKVFIVTSMSFTKCLASVKDILLAFDEVCTIHYFTF